MAIEKIQTVNGVDISVEENLICLYELNIESPVISAHINIPVSDWESIVKFVNDKINHQDAK